MKLGNICASREDEEPFFSSKPSQRIRRRLPVIGLKRPEQLPTNCRRSKERGSCLLSLCSDSDHSGRQNEEIRDQTGRGPTRAAAFVNSQLEQVELQLFLPGGADEGCVVHTGRFPSLQELHPKETGSEVLPQTNCMMGFLQAGLGPVPDQSTRPAGVFLLALSSEPVTAGITAAMLGLKSSSLGPISHNPRKKSFHVPTQSSPCFRNDGLCCNSDSTDQNWSRTGVELNRIGTGAPFAADGTEKL